MQFIDIGANLLDEMYQGVYNDKSYHVADLDQVLSRAWAAGLDCIIVTAGSLTEARAALELCARDDRLFCTVGCHPTRCGQFETHPGGPEAYLAELREVVQEGLRKGKVVAIGECGIDYDRLHFCDAATQRRYFDMQLSLAAEFPGLPLFLHLRGGAATPAPSQPAAAAEAAPGAEATADCGCSGGSAAATAAVADASPSAGASAGGVEASCVGEATRDFLQIYRRYADRLTAGGVVHSFDGTIEEARAVLEVPTLCIGLNGCSLKTEDNLKVVAQLPRNRIMIETDCPWCEIRNTHAGKRFITSPPPVAKDRKKHDPACQVKSRNEPTNIRQVLEVVAGCLGCSGEDAVKDLAAQVHATTARMFFPQRQQ